MLRCSRCRGLICGGHSRTTTAFGASLWWSYGSRSEKRCCILGASKLFRFEVALVQQHQPDSIVSFINESLPAVGTANDSETTEVHELALVL